MCASKAAPFPSEFLKLSLFLKRPQDYTKKSCSLVRCWPARTANLARCTKEGLNHIQECLHGSLLFIHDICSRLNGHRRYKYIWKSLCTVDRLFLHICRCTETVLPFYHIPDQVSVSPHVKWQPSTEIYQSKIYVFPAAASAFLFSGHIRCRQCFSSSTFLLVQFTTAACLVRSFMANHGGMTSSFITGRLECLGWAYLFSNSYKVD